jgi:hypothetical protein
MTLAPTRLTDFGLLGRFFIHFRFLTILCYQQMFYVAHGEDGLGS